MNVKIEQSWAEVLQEEFEKPYFSNLVDFVRKEYQSEICYPAAKNIFRAFDETPFSNTKVVILGQDPYHGVGQANGLCFSVSDGVDLPPSLKNIFKEIQLEFGGETSKSGDLQFWAKQGVLLLNATLTVRNGQAGSHQKMGWETFTDSVIYNLSNKKQNLVFILWGSYAKSKAELIDKNKHLILTAVHPSPLSAHRGFFGCNHFKQCNEYLSKNGLPEIQWTK